MTYHHRRIDRKLFEKYRRRFSPYCSVASLYLWAVAGGAIPEMKDYAPKNNRRKVGQTLQTLRAKNYNGLQAKFILETG